MVSNEHCFVKHLRCTGAGLSTVISKQPLKTRYRVKNGCRSREMQGSASAFQTKHFLPQGSNYCSPGYRCCGRRQSILNLLADGNVLVTLDCSYFETDFRQASLLAQPKCCRMGELAHKSRPFPRTSSASLIKAYGCHQSSSAAQLLRISPYRPGMPQPISQLT